MLSIIVTVRYRADLVQACLDSIDAYAPQPYELIIVQEGHEEGIDDLLWPWRLRGKFVFHDEPLGYVKAVNAGYRQISADSKWVLLLNSDTVLVPGCIEAMLATFTDKPKAGLVAPRLQEEGPQSIERKKEHGKYISVEMVKGCVLLLPRDLCDELIANNEGTKTQGTGLLDERFGLGGGDDNDLCSRITLLGRDIIIAGDAFVYHYNSASFRELFKHDVPYSKRHATQRFFDYKRKWGKQEKPRIFVAIPTLNGYVYHEQALALFQWMRCNDWMLQVKYFPFLRPVDSARNAIVKTFLGEYCDYLLCIDYDIVPPPDCLGKLLSADKDVIAPVCFVLKPDDNGLQAPMPMSMRRDKDGYRPHYGSGVEEVDIVTGGIFLVKREVLEKIKRPFHFTYHDDGTVEYGEDFAFSQNVQKAGFKVWTHYGLLCKHRVQTDSKNVNDLMVHVNRGR
jgi:GT2 family glycosyltransferase